ncbi:hexameric tyrosine-coordinated heme protein [Pontibacter chitinilyticus]|uniref:hexameric tyrosine-coordinated heme protein n=1 Tax=Pontibacter chitinilyticus TaxID=2674989 RepID=UPI00321B449E
MRQDQTGQELRTATPFEGRQLTVALARHAIQDGQPDQELRQQLLDHCVFNPTHGQKGAPRSKSAYCRVCAREMFQEIAKANDYWRHKD